MITKPSNLRKYRHTQENVPTEGQKHGKRCEVGLPGAGSWMIPASGFLFLITFFSVFLTSDPVQAQPVGVGPGPQVQKTNDLMFGTLLSGSSYTVQPTDSDAAAFIVRRPGPGFNILVVRFSLPNRLVGSATSVPVGFNPVSLEWDTNQNGNNRQSADPNVPQWFWVGPGTRLFFWLGGSVTIPSNTPNGEYGNVVVVTVSQIF